MTSENEDDRTVLRPGGGTLPRVPAPAAQDKTIAAPRTRVAEEAGNALPAGTVLGEFELTSVVGEGGFGIVYVAWDRSLQRKVAIKEYMPTSLASRSGASEVQLRSERHRETFELGLRSFINEARLLAQFDHPSLVKVYRFWEAHGTAYMVMPLYEGITLRDALRRMNGVPDEAWLMRVLLPLTEALAVIHRESCFHRDIAPDNIILLEGSNRPLLLDFGAARRVIGDMTQALTVILKPGYAPVEQYAEAAEMRQGPWTDVYALAATVHYAVTGRTPPTSVSRLVDDKYVPLAQALAGKYSDRFLRAMDHALQVRPEHRTPSVDALRGELGLPPAGRAAEHTAGPDTGVDAAPSTGTGARRGALWAVLGVAILAAAGVGVFLFRGGPDAAQPVAQAPQEPAPAPADHPPVTPAPVVEAALPVAQTFEIGNEFQQVLEGQTPGFSVRARADRPQLRIGRDRLGFQVQSDRAGFVQVLVLGPDGSLLLLFPNAQASDNRIQAGQTIQLPQSSWPLDVVEPAGQERFLVIVSAQPRDYGELSRERDYIFLKLPTGAQGAAAKQAWTRSTPLLLGSLRACPATDCEEYGAAAFDVEIVH